MSRALGRSWRRFWREDSGAVVIDYIPVFFVMIVIILVIFEIGIAYFLSLRAHKAAQLGARMAAVMPAIHAGVPQTNERPAGLISDEPTGSDGEPCFNPNGTDRCEDPGGPWVCDGAALDGACDADGFAIVVRDMRRMLGRLDGASVRITYVYRGLGETGGPFIPEVNVTIAAQEYTFAIFTVGEFCKANEDECLATEGQGKLGYNPAKRYGSVSASAYGENTAGLTPQVPAPPVNNENGS